MTTAEKPGRPRLNYELTGAGSPLVLLHGWTHDLRVWELQVPALARDLAVLAVDRRGWGQSGGRPDVSTDAEDLRTLLDELGIESAGILGHSQGAQSALSFALACPDRVDSLILVGMPPPAGFGVPWTGPDAMTVDVFQVMEDDGIDAVQEILFSHPLGRGFEEGGRGAEIVADLWNTNGERALADHRSLQGSAPPPAIEQLPGVAVPTLVVTGEWEIPYFQLVSDAVAYAVPRAERVVIPGGGHAIHVQQPERFNEEVLRFLSTVGRAGAEGRRETHGG